MDTTKLGSDEGTTRNKGSPDATNHCDIYQNASKNDLPMHKGPSSNGLGEMHREKIS